MGHGVSSIALSSLRFARDFAQNSTCSLHVCYRELLEPWVHYVPLNQNITDIEEKMQWVVENDYAARRIAERASLWMEDLCFHPDAELDDRLVQEEIVRRYRAHFRRYSETVKVLPE